eukprot:CAMPEP_0113685726 /NCGR_PEP_ID=MMETSP0038_2-20120614/14851_1 /TAXON_ID=2898 /ORGANISM="Cryptomonas paramecium" /LENGTH=239 /DNA_ID=CAMNT_0000605883 /DNA_START=32 /DNA_END=751 /DNA_ORIENTATION=- /assembly_acc=CAM_ASM_000170
MMASVTCGDSAMHAPNDEACTQCMKASSADEHTMMDTASLTCGNNTSSSTKFENVTFTSKPQSTPKQSDTSVKTKSKLTHSTVLEIFSARPKQQANCRKGDNEALRIAKIHGVTEKAVRDIWRGRTWRLETAELSSPADVAATFAACRRPGRTPKDRSVNDVLQQSPQSSPRQMPCSPPSLNPLSHFVRPVQDIRAQNRDPYDVNDFHQLPIVKAFDDPFKEDWPFWDSASAAVPYHGT